MHRHVQKNYRYFFLENTFKFFSVSSNRIYTLKLDHSKSILDFIYLQKISKRLHDYICLSFQEITQRIMFIYTEQMK